MICGHAPWTTARSQLYAPSIPLSLADDIIAALWPWRPPPRLCAAPRIALFWEVAWGGRWRCACSWADCSPGSLCMKRNEDETVKSWLLKHKTDAKTHPHNMSSTVTEKDQVKYSHRYNEHEWSKWFTLYFHQNYFGVCFMFFCLFESKRYCFSSHHVWYTEKTINPWEALLHYRLENT